MKTKLGDHVLIVAPTPGGKCFEIEGRAEVVDFAPNGQEHRYLVRFDDDEIVERLIHPMSQMLGARRYVAVVNAAITEMARFGAVDAETVNYAANARIPAESAANAGNGYTPPNGADAAEHAQTG